MDVRRTACRSWRLNSTVAAALAAAVALGAGGARAQEETARYRVTGDAIPDSLTGAAGDATRGRALVTNRHVGLCLLCHGGPFPEERFQGNIGPDLKGVGARLTAGQIRLRIVDPARLNPATIMPAYYRTEGLNRVAAAYRGKPVLSAAEIEDVVAFLATLRE